MGANPGLRRRFTALAHNHYQTMYIGDGATVEFALPTAVQRASDVTGVYVDAGTEDLGDARAWRTTTPSAASRPAMWAIRTASSSRRRPGT